MLKRGFALVRDADGQPLNSAEAVLDGQALVLEFADGKADATGGRDRRRGRELGGEAEGSPSAGGAGRLF